MNKNVKEIAALLPDGLTEKSVEDIALLVNNLIKENVDKKINALTSKVHAFIRMKMDTIKEASIAELTEEHEIFRDAESFRVLKSVMALEVTPEDTEAAVHGVKESVDEVNEENMLLAEELDTSLTDNQKLTNTIKLLNKKVRQLSEENEVLQDEINTPFESTERAIITTQDVDKIEETAPVKKIINNPFITEEMVRLSKFA